MTASDSSAHYQSQQSTAFEEPLGSENPLMPMPAIGINQRFITPLGVRTLSILDQRIFRSHLPGDITFELLFEESPFFPEHRTAIESSKTQSNKPLSESLNVLQSGRNIQPFSLSEKPDISGQTVAPVQEVQPKHEKLTAQSLAFSEQVHLEEPVAPINRSIISSEKSSVLQNQQLSNISEVPLNSSEISKAEVIQKEEPEHSNELSNSAEDLIQQSSYLETVDSANSLDLSKPPHTAPQQTSLSLDAAATPAAASMDAGSESRPQPIGITEKAQFQHSNELSNSAEDLIQQSSYLEIADPANSLDLGKPSHTAPQQTALSLDAAALSVDSGNELQLKPIETAEKNYQVHRSVESKLSKTDDSITSRTPVIDDQTNTQQLFAEQPALLNSISPTESPLFSTVECLDGSFPLNSEIAQPYLNSTSSASVESSQTATDFSVSNQPLDQSNASDSQPKFGLSASVAEFLPEETAAEITDVSLSESSNSIENYFAESINQNDLSAPTNLLKEDSNNLNTSVHSEQIQQDPQNLERANDPPVSKLSNIESSQDNQSPIRLSRSTPQYETGLVPHQMISDLSNQALVSPASIKQAQSQNSFDHVNRTESEDLVSEFNNSNSQAPIVQPLPETSPITPESPNIEALDKNLSPELIASQTFRNVAEELECVQPPLQTDTQTDESLLDAPTVQLLAETNLDSAVSSQPLTQIRSSFESTQPSDVVQNSSETSDKLSDEQASQVFSQQSPSDLIDTGFSKSTVIDLHFLKNDIDKELTDEVKTEDRIDEPTSNQKDLALDETSRTSITQDVAKNVIHAERNPENISSTDISTQIYSPKNIKAHDASKEANYEESVSAAETVNNEDRNDLVIQRAETDTQSKSPESSTIETPIVQETYLELFSNQQQFNVKPELPLVEYAEPPPVQLYKMPDKPLKDVLPQQADYQLAENQPASSELQHPINLNSQSSFVQAQASDYLTSEPPVVLPEETVPKDLSEQKLVQFNITEIDSIQKSDLLPANVNSVSQATVQPLGEMPNKGVDGGINFDTSSSESLQYIDINEQTQVNEEGRSANQSNYQETKQQSDSRSVIEQAGQLYQDERLPDQAISKMKAEAATPIISLNPKSSQLPTSSTEAISSPSSIESTARSNPAAHLKENLTLQKQPEVESALASESLQTENSPASSTLQSLIGSDFKSQDSRFKRLPNKQVQAQIISPQSSVQPQEFDITSDGNKIHNLETTVSPVDQHRLAEMTNDQEPSFLKVTQNSDIVNLDQLTELSQLDHRSASVSTFTSDAGMTSTVINSQSDLSAADELNAIQAPQLTVQRHIDTSSNSDLLDSSVTSYPAKKDELSIESSPFSQHSAAGLSNQASYTTIINNLQSPQPALYQSETLYFQQHEDKQQKSDCSVDQDLTDAATNISLEAPETIIENSTSQPQPQSHLHRYEDIQQDFDRKVDQSLTNAAIDISLEASETIVESSTSQLQPQNLSSLDNYISTSAPTNAADVSPLSLNVGSEIEFLSTKLPEKNVLPSIEEELFIQQEAAQKSELIQEHAKYSLRQEDRVSSLDFNDKVSNFATSLELPKDTGNYLPDQTKDSAELLNAGQQLDPISLASGTDLSESLSNSLVQKKVENFENNSTVYHLQALSEIGNQTTIADQSQALVSIDQPFLRTPNNQPLLKPSSAGNEEISRAVDSQPLPNLASPQLPSESDASLTAAPLASEQNITSSVSLLTQQSPFESAVTNLTQVDVTMGEQFNHDIQRSNIVESNLITSADKNFDSIAQNQTKQSNNLSLSSASELKTSAFSEVPFIQPSLQLEVANLDLSATVSDNKYLNTLKINSVSAPEVVDRASVTHGQTEQLPLLQLSTSSDRLAATDTPDSPLDLSGRSLDLIPQVLQPLSVLKSLYPATILTGTEIDAVSSQAQRQSNLSITNTVAPIKQAAAHLVQRQPSTLHYSTEWSSFADLVNGKVAPVRRQLSQPQAPQHSGSLAIPPIVQANQVEKPETIHLSRNSTNSKSVDAASSAEESECLETLAQVIYERLKQRLRIEQERRGKDYSGQLPW